MNKKCNPMLLHKKTMNSKYLFSSTSSVEVLSNSLETVVANAKVVSTAKSAHFKSYGDGISGNHFFMGNLITEHLEIIEVYNSNSYILTIPKKGTYSVATTQNKERIIDGWNGVLTLPTEKIVFDAPTDYIDDYTIYINEENVNRVLNTKYKISHNVRDLLRLDLKAEQVQTITNFIQSILTMLRSFPDARNSELVKYNLQEITQFMLAELIGESINAKPITNNYPEKGLVVLAEEIMEAKCESLFSIQEVADEVFTSPRNLQLAFKKQRNYTPMQFLKLRKLYKAHKNIFLNQHSKLTVKEIAHSVGIFDLNRFSKYYTKVFGELPSNTIQKSRRL